MSGGKRALQRLQNWYTDGVTSIKNKTSHKLERLKGSFRRGHQTLKSMTVEAEHMQLLFLAILFGIITLAGPLKFAVLSIDFTSSLYSILMRIIPLILLLVVLNRFRIIPPESTIGVGFYVLLNMIGGEIFLSRGVLGGFLGGETNAAVGIIIFFVASLLLVLRTMKIMSTRALTGIIIAIVLLLSLSQVIGYLSSQDAKDTAEFQQAKLKAGSFDVIKTFTNFFNQQRAKGNGSYIEGQNQNTFEFIGLEITSIQPLKSSFYTNEQVITDIDYQSNIYFPVTLFTACRIDGIGPGAVDEPNIEISSSLDPSVRCTFDSLPRGSYVQDVISIFNYESTVHIPLKIMDKEFSQALTKKRENPSQILEQYVGGKETAFTTSGPVQIGVATTGKTIQTPLLYDKDANRLTRIRLQLHEDELKGEVYGITSATFDVPAGLLIENCDFGKVTKAVDSLFGDRWLYTLDVQTLDVGSFETFGCDVAIDKSFILTFVPERMQWSPQSIFFTLYYDYKVEKSIPLKVIS